MKTAAGLWALLLCNSAFAVDFKISTETATVSNRRLHANFAVGNAEGNSFEGRVRIRAFLIPTRFPANGSPHAQPVLLPSEEFPIAFTGETAQLLSMDVALPNVPAGEYFLAAYVNSNVAIAESQRMNNVTEDLYNLGRVENEAPSADAQADDLYLDVPSVAVRPGAVGAAWRLFKRGNVDVSPSFFCLFLMANLAEQKLYISTYEKPTHWQNMGSDVDANGRTIPYDVYGNPVGFNHLRSGEYGVITWVDSREILRETDSSNNMNMRRTTISRAHLVSESDGWFSTAGATGTLTRTVSLVNDFTGQGTWAIDPATVPPGVTIVPMSGNTSQMDSNIPLNVTVNPDQFQQEGMYQAAVNVQVSQGVSETLPFTIRIAKTSETPMTAALNYSAALTVPKMQMVTGYIDLPNTLKQTVYYQVSSAVQSLYGLGTFSVMPGEVRRVEFTADSRALSIGNTNLNLVVSSTGYASPMSLPMTVTVNR